MIFFKEIGMNVQEKIQFALEQQDKQKQLKLLNKILKTVRVENKASIQVLIDNIMDNIAIS